MEGDLKVVYVGCVCRGGGVGCDEHYSSEGETQWQCPYGEQL